METALATYGNVHRGSGHHALATTHLYEQARDIVLEHFGLDPRRFAVVFCPPVRATRLRELLAAGGSHSLSSADLGLPLGICAVAAERKRLPRGLPLGTGGGTARLVGPGWVVWEKGLGRLEPGTPPIINVIAFAQALRLARRHGVDAFRNALAQTQAAGEPSAPDALAGRKGADLLRELRGTLIGGDVLVPTAGGERRYVNLDNAASTKTFRPIWEAVRWAFRAGAATHAAIVAGCKATIAETLGAPAEAYDVLFTSNTTQAVNLVAESLAKESGPSGIAVLGSLLEHNSNELPWRDIPRAALVRLAFDREGFLDPTALGTRLRESGDAEGCLRLVAVTGASNVLGTCQPLAAIAQVAKQGGARLLVDAAQLVARREIRMQEWGIDYLVFSGHKVYAPFGTGVLVARKGMLAFSPSELSSIRASGEENVAGIAGLGKALDLLRRIGFDVIEEDERALTRRLLQGLCRLPQLKVHGLADPDSPRMKDRSGVVSFDVKGRIASRVARQLAEQHGVGLRAGCHCAHLAVKRMVRIPGWAEHLQRFMLLVHPTLALPGVVRASLGLQSTEADVDALLQALAAIVEKRKVAASVPPLPEYLEQVSAQVFGDT